MHRSSSQSSLKENTRTAPGRRCSNQMAMRRCLEGNSRSKGMEPRLGKTSSHTLWPCLSATSSGRNAMQLAGNCAEVGECCAERRFKSKSNYAFHQLGNSIGGRAWLRNEQPSWPQGRRWLAMVRCSGARPAEFPAQCSLRARQSFDFRLPKTEGSC